MIRWTLYILTAGFAVYWASNLLLWFPWSHSAVLGMTLMLTVSPILWGYVTFLCLRTYPRPNPTGAALRIALAFGLMAAVMDYIFFGVIRNAMQELYHPTTLYAYGFLILLPFIVSFLLKNRIQRTRGAPSTADFVLAGLSGIICLGILALIIAFEIEI